MAGHSQVRGRRFQWRRARHAAKFVEGDSGGAGRTRSSGELFAERSVFYGYGQTDYRSSNG